MMSIPCCSRAHRSARASPRSRPPPPGRCRVEAPSGHEHDLADGAPLEQVAAAPRRRRRAGARWARPGAAVPSAMAATTSAIRARFSSRWRATQPPHSTPTTVRLLSSTRFSGTLAMPPVNPITQNRPSNFSARSDGLRHVAADHVVDDVDALAAGELAGPRLHVLGQGVDGRLRPHRDRQRPLLLARRHGDHPGAERAGHVDGGQTDAAARAGHEHDLAGSHDRAVLEREPRGAVDLHERRAAAEVEAGGQSHQLPGRRPARHRRTRRCRSTRTPGRRRRTRRRPRPRRRSRRPTRPRACTAPRIGNW